MADHKILNKVIALFVFILAFFIFFTTMAPTVSFWDCGEYIASCYSLGIPHPPGNPFFILLGRVFTMIIHSDQVAFRVNLISVITGAFSALFMYLIVVRSVVGVIGTPDELWKKAIAYVGGIVGASFAVFNYTFWFSAIEASVYIPSILTIIINVYLAIVWAQSKDRNRDRYLLLFSYLSFLGVGLHMFALFSLIPIFAYVLMVDKEKRFDWRLWGVAFIMGSVAYDVSSFIVVAPVLFILLGIMAYIPKTVAGILTLVTIVVLYFVRIVNFANGFEEFTGEVFKEELFHIILLSLPYFIIGTMALADLAVENSKIDRQYSWKFCFYMVFFALIGYSVHLYIPIRSALEPMIDENHPVVRLDNDGKGAKGHEAFMDALMMEAPVNEFYKEYIREVSNDSTLYPLYKELNNAIDKSALVSDKSTKDAKNAFDAAVLADSLILSKKQLFEASLVENIAVEKAFKDFSLLMESNAGRSKISNAYEEFKKSLSTSDEAKKAYVAYIKSAKAGDNTKSLYNEYISSFKFDPVSKVYAKFAEAQDENRKIKNLSDRYLDAVKRNSELNALYEKYMNAIKSNDSNVKKHFLAFQNAVDNERGPIEAAYLSLLDAAEEDSAAKKLMVAYEDDIKLSFVGTKNYKAFTDYLSKSETLSPKYEAFTSALNANSAVKAQYDAFVKSLNFRKLTSFKMDAFKGFLERKQYGSESMIIRAFHRRGALETQFGFDGHMGLLGFHLTQFYHFGESINTDRAASRADEPGAIEENHILKTTGVLSFIGQRAAAPDKPEEGMAYFDSEKRKAFYYKNKKWNMLGSSSQKYRFRGSSRSFAYETPKEKYKRNDVVFDTQSLTFQSYNGKSWSRMGTVNPFNLMVILIYLLPSFFVIFGIWYWATKLDINAAVLFFLLLLSTTIGFAIYMNFADGTRPDSAKDVKRHEESYKIRYDNYKQQLNYYMNNPQIQQMIDYYVKNNQPIPRELQKPEAPKKGPAPSVHREVRIRDYFYTAGFTFFGLWIGLSAVALLHFFFTAKVDVLKGPLAFTFSVLFLFSPILPIWSNYDEHDRTDDWIPYDYAYNLLMSCKENAILFTNGDNDTFPLWFLQEAEGIRKDVRVVNFSLLNTPWYIRQLRDLEPLVPIPYNDFQIEPSDDRTDRQPKSYADFMSMRKSRDKLEVMSPNPYGYFEDAPETVTLPKCGLTLTPPTFKDQRYLTIANLLVHDIIDNNNWNKPVYFTVNTPPVSLMGTEPYLEIQGMVQELKKTPVTSDNNVNLERTKYLLDSVYQFRVLEDDMHVEMSETADKTARNYAYVFLRYVDAYSGYGHIKGLERQIHEDKMNIPRFEMQISKLNEAIHKLSADTSNPNAAQQLEEYKAYLSRYSSELQMMKMRKTTSELRLPGEIDKFRKKLPEILPYIDRATKISPDIEKGMNYRDEFMQLAGPGYGHDGYPIGSEKAIPKKETPLGKTVDSVPSDSTVVGDSAK